MLSSGCRTLTLFLDGIYPTQGRHIRCIWHPVGFQSLVTDFRSDISNPGRTYPMHKIYPTPTAGSDRIYLTQPKSVELDSEFRDNLKGLNDSLRQELPPYIYEGLRPIEVNPNRNKEHFSFIFCLFIILSLCPTFSTLNYVPPSSQRQ
jgi:hypothetical protein